MFNKKRAKKLHKTITCSVPANIGKIDRAKEILEPYQNAMVFFINYMNNQLVLGNDILQHTSLKPADLNSPMSARFTQEAYTQAHETFLSYLGWLTNKVRTLITNSSLDDYTKITLYRLNNQHAWYKKEYSLDWDITANGELLVPTGKNSKDNTKRISKNVSQDALFLLRKLIKKVKQWISLPNLSNVRTLKLSAQTMELQQSNNSFMYWLNMSTLYKRKRVLLPLKHNKYLQQELLKGRLNKQVQVTFKDDDRIVISPVIEQSTVDLRERGNSLGLDWGMVNLFTTSDGRKFGNKMMRQLRIYDSLLMDIQAELQRKQIPLKTNAEYQKLQSKIRNLVKNEIGRILNKLSTEDLKELIVEKLNFAGSGMSKTMNRLLTRAGRKFLQDKLSRLDEEQGLTTSEVQPAYTSQMCNKCKYVDKRNRPNQKTFRCLCCGYKTNADVNAAKNILQRRSLKISLRNSSAQRKTLKDRILESHSKICPSGIHLSTNCL